jgi:hypothetical protein
VNIVLSPAAAQAVPDPVLAEHAAEIRRLRKRAAEDIIEIGRLLTICKGIVGHGNWLDWLEREFSWTDKTAERFMAVAAAAEAGKFDKLSNLNIGASSLYLLAKPSTPQTAIDEVAERAEAGKEPSTGEVKRIIEERKAAATETTGPVSTTNDTSTNTTSTTEAAAKTPPHKERRSERAQRRAAEMKRIARKLIQLDSHLARAVHDLLQEEERDAHVLVSALGRGLGIDSDADEDEETGEDEKTEKAEKPDLRNWKKRSSEEIADLILQMQRWAVDHPLTQRELNLLDSMRDFTGLRRKLADVLEEARP